MNRTIFKLEAYFYLWDDDRRVVIAQESKLMDLLEHMDFGLFQERTERFTRHFIVNDIYSDKYNSVEDVLKDYINYPMTIKEFLEI